MGTEIICHPAVSNFEIYRSREDLLGEDVLDIFPEHLR